MFVTRHSSGIRVEKDQDTGSVKPGSSSYLRLISRHEGDEFLLFYCTTNTVKVNTEPEFWSWFAEKTEPVSWPWDADQSVVAQCITLSKKNQI